MDRDFRKKRSQGRREWAAILGVLLLVLCQLYRVSGKKLWVADVLPAKELQAGIGETLQSAEAVKVQTQMQAGIGETLQSAEAVDAQNRIQSQTQSQTQNQAQTQGESSGEGEEPAFSLHAKGAVLMDGYTGRVLYEKNASETMPMASTTKIMTCIVALEYGNPDDRVEVSAYAASMPDVQLGINKGEHYRLGDLLFSLMLESHNDAAVAIAEHIASSESAADYMSDDTETAEKSAAYMEAAEKSAAERTMEESKALVSAFAGLMNQKAKAIGCEDTFFITPNGLDASVIMEDEEGNQREQVHSTTARELALIMRYCLSQSEKSQDFLELTQTRDVAITDETGSRSFTCTNHNRYLDMKEGALSGKTGFTGKAGYCYVGAVNQDGVYLIAALLACGWPPSKSLKWQDMNTLVNYGLENYSCVQVKELQEKSVDYLLRSYNERGKTTGVEKIRTEIEFEPFTVLMKTGETLSSNWYLDMERAAPGETVGACQVMIGEKLCRTFPVLVKKMENGS